MPAAPKRRAIDPSCGRLPGPPGRLLVGGAGFAVAWYARGSYFVGLTSDELTIYKGRPGGLLWFQPTVARQTQVRTSDVLPSRLADLKSREGRTIAQPGPGLRDAACRSKKAQHAQGTTTATTTARRGHRYDDDHGAGGTRTLRRPVTVPRRAGAPVAIAAATPATGSRPAGGPSWG